jgi:hypothetical protein
MIKTASNCPDLVSISSHEILGGHAIELRMTTDMLDTLNWIQQYRSQLEKEAKIREQDPVAQQLWTEYRTYLDLVHK